MTVAELIKDLLIYPKDAIVLIQDRYKNHDIVDTEIDKEDIDGEEKTVVIISITH